MRRIQAKWYADRGARAQKTIAGIEASIGVLGNEDLLDLEDIFRSQTATAIAEMIAVEMKRRDLQP